ncbi:hypothetical protein C2E23DRAFT_890490, partial [Lenzites betulinus]
MTPSPRIALPYQKSSGGRGSSPIPPLSPTERPWTYAQVVASPPGSPKPRAALSTPSVTATRAVLGEGVHSDTVREETDAVKADGPPADGDRANATSLAGLHPPRRGLPVTPPRTTTAVTVATAASADREKGADGDPLPPPVAPVTPTSHPAPPPENAPRSVRTIDHRRARHSIYPQYRPTSVRITTPRPPTPPRLFGDVFGGRSRMYPPATEPPTAGPSTLRGFERESSNPFIAPSAVSLAATPEPPHARRGVRFNDDELADQQPPRGEAMELDLPLFYRRPGGGEFGMPLSELDINRVRFPNALRRDPPATLPPLPNDYTLHAGNTPGPSRPIPIRSPTPRASTSGSMFLNLTTPRDPVSALFRETISPSNARPNTPAPISALGGGPPSPFRFTPTLFPPRNSPPPLPLFADNMAMLYNASQAVDPAYTFTPTPAGGFPDVAWQDPEALFYGLPRSRM